MDRDTFLNLPTPDLAALVRQSGPKVCVFPINGTRRWYLLEHAPDASEKDYLAAYLAKIEPNHVDLYRLLFDHGIEYLLTPAFGPDLAERGPEYVAIVAHGLARLGTEKLFLDFFEDYNVRVRFYGDYRPYFENSPHAAVLDVFDDLTARTAHHDRFRLFFGLFGHDATETIAQLSVDHYRQHGSVPDKRTLIERYYGEYVPPVDMFIGFDTFSTFDMPLIAMGAEDLYFTINPSPYLTDQQLRDILFDHLYSRRIEPDYSSMEPDEWDLMREFYRVNMGKTLGVGGQQARGNYWFPLPQVTLPPTFNEPKP
ncbi:MAG: diterpene synthase [Anaerolineae bacterium]|nr:diterpene synthase [Anaerolineae bacterium]